MREGWFAIEGGPLLKLTPAKIVIFFTFVVVLMHPPMVLGLLGPEGRRMGNMIEEGLGTDTMRVAVFGRR
jgi:hypothetical protein